MLSSQPLASLLTSFNNKLYSLKNEPFPKRQILDSSNLKGLQTTILSSIKMAESSPKRLKNTVGEGENARYEQFLLFPQCFEDLYEEHVKTRACLGKG